MKLKPSYFFIAMAALAQGVMWWNVFTVLGLYDGFAIAGGICAGGATVGMSTLTANYLPGANVGKRARRWGWTVLIMFVCVEMVVLGNSNYIVMPMKSYITAYGAALVITLSLIAGALVDRSLVAKPQPARSTKRTTKATKQTAKSIMQEIEPAKVYECTWPGCEWNTSQSKAVQKGGEPVPALAAHVSHHNRKMQKIEAEKEAAKAER